LTRKPVRPRQLAHQDVQAAILYYLREAGPDVTLGFIDALEAAFRGIAEHPAAGTPRYAHELALPGLRGRRLKRYPYLVFYVEREDHIDVWRVLHAERDIPVWMQPHDKETR
jgi:toxin ParE1/3/4